MSDKSTTWCGGACDTGGRVRRGFVAPGQEMFVTMLTDVGVSLVGLLGGASVSSARVVGSSVVRPQEVG